MPVIDMSELKPVGEFGSREWGEVVVRFNNKNRWDANGQS